MTTPGAQVAAVTLARSRLGRRLPARRVAIRRSRRTVLYAVLIAGGILMMIPFLWMVMTSLKTRAEVFGGAAAQPPDRRPLGELRARCGTRCRA